jgi:CHAT domain-containing protein
MKDILDLAILNVGTKKPTIVYARCASDVAVAEVPAGTELEELIDFRERIDRSIRKMEVRPSSSLLEDYGYKLFNFIIRDEVQRLYQSVAPDKLLRIHIFSNSPELQAIPWEYLQDPAQGPGPSVDRLVVRIVSTIGVTEPKLRELPKDGNKKLKMLFASADPVEEDPVSWLEVKKAIERAFATAFPADSFDPEFIDASPEELADKLQNNTYDIFHFCGHGDVDAETQEGRIILLNRKTNERSPLRASVLKNLLKKRGVKLVVLSACNTATVKSSDKFATTAQALVCAGIPAVVANQLPVPDESVATFVEQMYKTLIATGDIDLAVCEGRVRLETALSLPAQQATLEWGIPVLYRHIAAAHLLETPKD